MSGPLHFKPLLFQGPLYSRNSPKVSSGLVFFLFILVILVYALLFPHDPGDPGCPFMWKPWRRRLPSVSCAQAYVRRPACLRVGILTCIYGRISIREGRQGRQALHMPGRGGLDSGQQWEPVWLRRWPLEVRAGVALMWLHVSERPGIGRRTPNYCWIHFSGAEGCRCAVGRRQAITCTGVSCKYRVNIAQGVRGGLVVRSFFAP